MKKNQLGLQLNLTREETGEPPHHQKKFKQYFATQTVPDQALEESKFICCWFMAGCMTKFNMDIEHFKKKSKKETRFIKKKPPNFLLKTG